MTWNNLPMTSDKTQKKKAPGRPEERVVIEGDWRDAVAKALQKPQPAKPKASKRRKK